MQITSQLNASPPDVASSLLRALMPQLPTERLVVSRRMIIVVLPGLRKICTHLTGAKLQAHLNRDPNDPILIRIGDRNIAGRFDQALAKALGDLQSRFFALNRQNGGALAATYSDVSMIAFALRLGAGTKTRRQAWCKTIEGQLENRRKRLKRATQSELGIQHYDSLHERWSAFMAWIRHKLAYEKQLGSRTRRKAKQAEVAIRATKPPKARANGSTEVRRNSVDVAIERLICKLAQSRGTELSGMELRRGISLVKERARKGGFNGYLLRDLLENENIFTPMLDTFLCAKRVLVDLSVAQSGRAAKIREKLTIQSEPREVPASPKVETADSLGGKVESRPARVRSRPKLTPAHPTGGTQILESTHSDSAIAQRSAGTQRDVASKVKAGREHLLQSTVLYMSHMSPSFRTGILFELRDLASWFVASPYRGDLTEPSEHFERLEAENCRNPFMEAKGILTILCRFVSVPDAVGIVEEACGSLR